MAKKVTIEIDGREIQAAEGANLLETAREAGLEIPGLCHHPRLSPTASCRLCVVKIDGSEWPAPACTTEVSEGLEVVAFDEDLESWRRQLVDLIFSQHDCNCVNCDMAGDCDLQDMAYSYGLIGLNSDKFRQVHRDARSKFKNFPTFGSSSDRDKKVGSYTGEASDCIRCSYCVEACKMNLYPVLIMEAEEMDDREMLKRLHPEDCINCELCSYVCPSQIGLPEYLQRAKRMKEDSPVV